MFPLRLLASVLGYLSMDSVAGTGMGILAGTWLTNGLIMDVHHEPGVRRQR